MSGENIISIILGGVKLFSIILFNPAPKDVPTNNCGAKPSIEPKK